MSESARHPLSFYELEGEIELGRGDVISTIDLANFPGSYPVYSSSAVGLGEFGRYGRYMFDEELITWSIDGGGRPFHRKKHRYSVTNVCGFLRIKRPDIWDYRYLHALLEKLQSGIQFDYQMKAHPSVIRELYKFERAPIAEQRKIGQILDTLDTAIRETEALIDKLKAVKQGLLHDLLTCGIDANGQLRPPQSEAPQLYKESPLGWIPREWDCTSVAAIADVKSGATPAREMAHLYYADTGISWVKTLDLNEGIIVDTDERITVQGLRGSSCVEFPAGTVLVAMYGGWEQIGRTGLLAAKAATNQAISALVFRVDHISPEFVLRAMQHGRPRWQRVAASTRKDPNITKTDVMEFLLPIPPKLEQEEIARRYCSVLDQLRIEQEQALKLKQQKYGLMDDLLTGRVRVTPLLESVQQDVAPTEA